MCYVRYDMIRDWDWDWDWDWGWDWGWGWGWDDDPQYPLVCPSWPHLRQA